MLSYEISIMFVFFYFKTIYWCFLYNYNVFIMKSLSWREGFNLFRTVVHLFLFFLFIYQRLGGHIVFGPDSISVGVGICVGMTVSCLEPWIIFWIQNVLEFESKIFLDIALIIVFYLLLSGISFLMFSVSSDEDTDVKALIHSWLSKFPESEQQVLSGYIEDYFYRALDWVLKQVNSLTVVLVVQNWIKPVIIIAPDKMLFFFNQKLWIFFLFLQKNICCRYSLEVPQWVFRTCFLAEIRKIFTWYLFLSCMSD